jgi:hypothetical protein
METFIKSFITLAILVGVSAHAETLAKSSCSKDSERRVIEIQRDPHVGGCALMYTKFDVRKRIAKSRYNSKHCEEVKESIEKNLAGSGYACSPLEAVDDEKELAIQQQKNLEAWNSRNPASE